MNEQINRNLQLMREYNESFRREINEAKAFAERVLGKPYKGGVRRLLIFHREYKRLKQPIRPAMIMRPHRMI